MWTKDESVVEGGGRSLSVSHILPVLGERTVLYLNPLKFIVSSVEGSEGSLTTGSGLMIFVQ
jgi:hypothetical protein